MKNLCRILVFSVIGFLMPITVTYAALELELTQGVNSAVPIVLMPFLQTDTQDSSEQLKQLQQVIHNDLIHSGRLMLKTPTHNLLGQKSERINFSYWQAQQVDRIVQGTLKRNAQQQWQLTLDILDSYKEPHLIARTTFTAPRDEWRDLAHRASDWLYQQILGEHGIFSTHLAYVVVMRHPGIRTAYRLAVADADGARPHILVESSQPIMSPAWSPDAKHIAYVSFEAHHAQIYTIELSTGKRTLITDFPGVNGAPSWSPDGKRLALVLSKEQQLNIYLYDFESRRVTQLTKSWAINTEPQWTPDGRAIIFTSDRGGHPQVYRIELDSHELTRITFAGPFHACPQITPDNKYLITLHRSEGLYNIAIQDLESGQLRLLTQTGRASSPSVSPNGKMVVYSSRNGGRGVLEVVSVDGKVTWRLPASEGDVQEPAWSPYGVV